MVAYTFFTQYLTYGTIKLKVALTFQKIYFFPILIYMRKSITVY